MMGFLLGAAFKRSNFTSTIDVTLLETQTRDFFLCTNYETFLSNAKKEMECLKEKSLTNSKQRSNL